MNKKGKTSLLLALPLMAALSAGAQNDPIYISGSVYISDSSNTQWYSNVELGPNAQLYITDNQKAYFYGAQFKADPGAKIYGTNSSWTTLTQGAGSGSTAFVQPNPMDNSTVQQTLDGGNSGNPANATQNTLASIEINNNLGVKLVNTDSRIGGTVTFTNGHLYTDAHDMVLSSAATCSNYDASKYIVTNLGNAAGGHLVKESYTGAFTFPVGKSDGDYTPAVITSAAANTIHVNVTDYAGSTPVENNGNGIDRTWNIFGNNNNGAIIGLQHNTATNNNNFSNTSNYVTRYGISPNNTGDLTSQTAWQVNTAAAGTTGSVAGAAINSRAYTALATTASANEAFFTKATNIQTAPPDFTTLIDIDRLDFAAGDTRDFAIDIFELAGQPSNGQVAFRIPKIPSYTITYSTTASTVNVSGSYAVNNVDWDFTQTSSYILCTLKAGKTIPGYGISSVGFTVQRNVGSPAGVQNIAAVIVAGSGGDSQTANNSVTTIFTAQ